jgi:thiol-activated cytolysin
MKRSLFSALALSFFLHGCGTGQGSGGDPRCGDGIVDAGEGCDDGNDEVGDGCDPDCQPGALCGDGELSEGEECPGDQAEEIDAYLRNLSGVPAGEEETVVNSEAGPEAQGDYSCLTQNLTQTTRVEEVSVLGGSTTGLFPGALLRGDSLYTGQFAEAAFARQPMTYSLSVQDGTGAARSATMEDPSLSTFRDTVGGVLAQANLGAVPVSFEVTAREVFSEQDLAVSLGVSVETAQATFEGKFDFNNNTKLSRFLVTVEARFFTADVDAIVNPSDLFADSVTPDEVRTKFFDQNPPVYVSSVTYGSRVYFTVESTFASQEVSAAIDASFKSLTASGDGSVALSSKEVFNSSSLDFVAFGLSQEQITQVGAILTAQDKFAAIQSLIAQAQFFSAENIGEPLLFQLKHLADNSLAALALTGTFDVRTCLRVSQNLLLTFEGLLAQNIDEEVGQGGDALELYGDIRARSLDSLGNQVTLFSRGEAQAVTVVEGEERTFGGFANQKILRINPEEQRDLRITLDLVDDDLAADDELGVLNVTLPFALGFNHQDLALEYPTSAGDITVFVTLTPIP